MTQNDHEQTADQEIETEQNADTDQANEGQATREDLEGIGAEAAPESQEVGELDELRAQVEQLESQAAEYLDGWQRARAEFSNYRKREEQRRQQMHQQIRSQVFKRLLPALDDMERAFQTAPEGAKDDPFVQGLEMVGQKLQSALEKDGLSTMATQPGDPFDPNVHEAVLCEPSEEFDEGQIIQVLQTGYRIDETVLRPALVRVSSGKTLTQPQDE